MPNLAATLCMVIGRLRFAACRRCSLHAGPTAPECLRRGEDSTIVTRANFWKRALQAQVDALRNVSGRYLETCSHCQPRGQALGRGPPDLSPVLGRGVDPESAGGGAFYLRVRGRPKGVVLSHRAILSNIAQIRAITTSRWKTDFNALPVFHRSGWSQAAAADPDASSCFSIPRRCTID